MAVFVMMPEMIDQTLEKLPYTGDLGAVVTRIARDYRLGKVDHFKKIEVGYEDLNVLIGAGGKKFLAKIFAYYRAPERVQRYANIIRAVTDHGIRHPKLITSPQGDLYQDESGVSLVLMEYVEGKTFLEMNRAPDEDELDQVLEQAARINQLNLKPPVVFDAWSVQNLEGAYQKIQSYLNQEDLNLVQKARQRFQSIPLDKLPHTFVHGDITKANTILSKSGEIYVIDFSVSNWYPRIQELAVIGANLMHDPTNPTRPLEIVPGLISRYRHYGELTKLEEKYLPDYMLGAISMELLGGSQVKYLLRSDSEETRYWIELGRKSLQKALEI